jgi:hypothetical protein
VNNIVVRDICTRQHIYDGTVSPFEWSCLANGNNYLVEVFDRANGWSAGSNITVRVNGIAVQ